MQKGCKHINIIFENMKGKLTGFFSQFYLDLIENVDALQNGQK